MDTFRFRLNCIDHYQAVPTELDPVLRRAPGSSQRYNAPTVPVIRVFGATETGQKVCAHIHGALPYLYLEYHGSLGQDALDEYTRDLRTSIDHALANTYRRNPYDGKAVYVGHITLVKGIPYFGYHVGYKFFLKVYLLNPVHMTRFVDLLHQGSIMNRVFQPYEGHLQYLLQWMCDYNLYGCAYIDCAKVKFRGPVPDSDIVDTDIHKWHDASIPDHILGDQGQYPRQSHCSLEVDICVQDILNRHELRPRSVHNKPFEPSLVLKGDEKYVPSMAGLWRDETMRRKRRLGLSNPSSSPFPPEVLVSMSADARTGAKGDWIHEEEYRERLEQLVQDESKQVPDVNQATFLKPVEGENRIQTALESVEDLYPERMATQTLLPGEDDPEPPNEYLLVDSVARKNILQVEKHSNLPDISDERSETPSDFDVSPSWDPLSIFEAEMQPQSNQGDGSSNNHPNGVGDANKLNLTQDASHVRGSRKRSLSLSDDGNRNAKRLLSDRTDSAETLVPSAQADEHMSQNGPISFVAHQASQNDLSSQYSTGSSIWSYPIMDLTHAPSTILHSSQAGHTDSQDDSFQSDMDSGMDETGSEDLELSQQSEAETQRSHTLHFALPPPSIEEVEESMSRASLLPVLYQNPYYSKEADVPERSREYAGREHKLQSITLPYLPPFNPFKLNWPKHEYRAPKPTEEEKMEKHLRPLRCTLRNWELCSAPPSFKEVEQWLQKEVTDDTVKPAPVSTPLQRRLDFFSQIEGPTQRNKHGFKYSQKMETTSVKHEAQYMSIMSLEVHVNSRGVLAPDPAIDKIQSIFWCVQGEEGTSDDQSRIGILCLSHENGIVNHIHKQAPVAVEAEEDELDLINRIVDIVRYFDPDVLTGYEVHNNSWGYLIERARLKYEYDFCDEISRMKSQSHGRFGKEADRWGFTNTSTIRVTGRHMINIWRAMRGELNLLQYTMENVVFHLLHKRIPHYQHADLTLWYKSSKPRDLAKVLEYFVTRIQLNLDILEANEIIPRTSEQARLLGVDFFSVISRGSQFKVESTMFRIAKPENFILVSPSRKQVGRQNALECLPLVMEPQSAFYTSPVLVLDFQSLYPSVMIAYNYCYSTCLGRVVPFRGRNKLGFMDYKREPGMLGLAKDHINIAPNGMMYVKPEMRKSLLAKMLGELLETRVMVKSGMKEDKDDKTLQQLLNNRQLALKLLANVTYGYTSASFSGRMPSSEIADSIVQTGRETLEKAIALIHSVEKWGAEVVYGDTDSLFIHLKGRTREQAFNIGEEIAEAVTQANPRPIKLKFEKVYHPCVLLAKKRYVGFKYESRDQTEPEFDAKGIETVRRDGTPAEQKIEEKALKILFRTKDLSQVKEYFVSQCAKIMEGRVSIQDFLFAKEVKLGTYSDRGPAPPGALIAAKRMLADPRTEPQYGERVPYVVVTGAPGARLGDRCVAPETLLKNDHLQLDAEYYITKNLIPPLERIFNLVGANVRQWYDQMPKRHRIRTVTLPWNHQKSNGIKTISGKNPMRMRTLESYLTISTCVLCRRRLPTVSIQAARANPYAKVPLCRTCLRKPARALLELKETINDGEKRVRDVEMVCRSCSNTPWGDEIKCDSRDCPVFYTRLKQKNKFANLQSGLSSVVDALEDDEFYKHRRRSAKRAAQAAKRKKKRLEW